MYLLNEVEEMRIVGRRPVGRPRKKWRACLTEDMNTLRIEEHMAHDRQLWKAVITRLTMMMHVQSHAVHKRKNWQTNSTHNTTVCSRYKHCAIHGGN